MNLHRVSRDALTAVLALFCLMPAFSQEVAQVTWRLEDDHPHVVVTFQTTPPTSLKMDIDRSRTRDSRLRRLARGNVAPSFQNIQIEPRNNGRPHDRSELGNGASGYQSELPRDIAHPGSALWLVALRATAR